MCVDGAVAHLRASRPRRVAQTSARDAALSRCVAMLEVLQRPSSAYSMLSCTSICSPLSQACQCKTSEFRVCTMLPASFNLKLHMLWQMG